MFLSLLLVGVGLISIGCSALNSVTSSDSAVPTITAVDPVTLSTGVAINRSLAITFSEAMDPTTITSASVMLKAGTSVISGTVSYAGTVATFTPASNLSATTVYTITVTTAVKSAAGVALAEAYAGTFTTGSTADTTAPTVGSLNPANLGTNVALTANVTVVFSEAMDPTTITSTTFTLTHSGSPISGTVTYSSQGATFNPASSLDNGTTYTATITTGAKDLAGNAITSAQTWTFTTKVALGPDAVNLRTAGNFAILAKTGVSSVPSCVITGALGVSPIDSTAITGFSLIVDSSGQFSTSTQVTGHIYAPDYSSPTPTTMTTAIGDMETAYTDAAGRITPDFSELGAGDISGRTLVPGLYNWSSSLGINSDIYLSGGANDVWILQVAGNINLAAGITVHLSGGAQAKNIFWQTAGAVTMGSGSHFEGIILAKTQISILAGGSINGRLLSQTAVTLISTTVTQPTD